MSRHDAYRATCRAEVMRRARAPLGIGCCEGCAEWKPLEWAHVFGRRHIVAEPLASSPLMTRALCGHCHDRLDGRTPDPAALASAYRRDVILTAYARLGLGIPPTHLDTMGAARHLDRLVRYIPPGGWPE